MSEKRLGLRALGLCAALYCLSASFSPLDAQTRRISCSAVIAELDSVVSRRGAAPADPVKLGKEIDVDPLWVERCAQAYGRRLARSPRRSGLSKEEQDIVWESEEPDEVGPEELEARGEDYFDEIPNDRQDRSRLRRFKPDTTTSNEWQPFVTHEWAPDTGREWQPFLLDK